MLCKTVQLYRHFDKDQTLLYVGLTNDVFRRLSEHKLGTRWFEQITHVSVEHFDTREEAQQAETKAIETEAPLHNLKLGPHKVRS